MIDQQSRIQSLSRPRSRRRVARVIVIVAVTLMLHAMVLTGARNNVDASPLNQTPTTISVALLRALPPPAPASPPVQPRPRVKPPQPVKPASPTLVAAAPAIEPAPPAVPQAELVSPTPEPEPSAPEPAVAPLDPSLPMPESETPTELQPPVPPAPPVEPAPQLLPDDALHSGRLVYRLTHSRFAGVTGRTVLDWKVDPASGKYEIRLRAGALGFEVEMRSEGEMGSGGLVPHHYQQGRRTVDFDWDSRQARMSDNGQVAELAAGTQDMLSFQFQVPLLAQAYPWRFTPGSVVVIPVVRPNALESYEFAVDGFETVRTGTGDMTTLKISRAKSAEHDGIELWLAPQLQWLPVRLRVDDKRNDIWDNLLIDAPSAAAIEREERRAANGAAVDHAP